MSKTTRSYAAFLIPGIPRPPPAFERLLEDLGFQPLLAEQSLQLAHLALQGSVISTTSSPPPAAVSAPGPPAGRKTALQVLMGYGHFGKPTPPELDRAMSADSVVMGGPYITEQARNVPLAENKTL